jgi:hypothetical protein
VVHFHGVREACSVLGVDVPAHFGTKNKY